MYRDKNLAVAEISKAVFVAVIFTFTAVGNGFVSFILIKYRRVLLKNRPTYQFILNMVLSDLVVSLFKIPFHFVRILCSE